MATGGNTVVITGTGLSTVNDVQFNGTPAVIQGTPTSTNITVVVPNNYTWGPVDIYLSKPNSDEIYLTAAYTYLAPVINTVSPDQGSVMGGTPITISGSHFAGINGISFGYDYVDSFIIVNSSIITTVTPASSYGAYSGTVYFETDVGTVEKTNAFTYTSAAVSEVLPTSGSIAGGTHVTITGTGLNAVQAVYIGGVEAVIDSASRSDTNIAVVTPVLDPGVWPVELELVVTGELLNTGRTFTVSNPVVDTLLPAAGSIAGGTSVTLTGTGLAAVLGVYIGGYEATIVSQSDTAIVVTSPTSASNPGAGTWPVTLDLVTSVVIDTGKTFTFTNPVVNTVLPDSGPVAGGTQVTLTGTGLNAVVEVYIGGYTADIATKTDTTIVVTTPILSAGPQTIELALDLTTINTGKIFTYLTAQINSIAPTDLSSLGGETIVITGANFTGVQDIYIGGNSPGSFTVNSDTQIMLTTPGYITGTANVELQMADNTTVMGAQTLTFTAPQITGFSPSSGAAIGGTAVTVSGSYFTPAVNALRLGNNEAGSFQYVDRNTLTLTTPAGSPGNVSAWLSATTGASYFFNNVFTYLAPPTLSNVSPNSTDVNGGITITITGNNFSPGMTASIAGIALNSVQYINATTLTANVPVLPEGIQTLSVSNTSGETVSLPGAFLVRPSPLFMAGDLAPLNNPDGALNVADVLVLQRMVMGMVTPSPLQQIIGDVAPLGAPDGELNAADIMLLQRAVSNQVTLPVAVENRPPQISIVSPADGGYTTSGSVTLIGLLNEAGIVEVNGVAVAVDNMLTFTQTIAVNEGSNSIAISATDIYGNTATRNVTVYRDTKPPAPIDINRVSITTAGGIATVTGSAGSVEANATVNVTVDTQLYTATANADGSFTLQLDASSGELLQIHVSDLADNLSATVGYTLGASLQILTPLANSTVADNRVNVVGVYVGEQNSGISVNGQAACTFNNHFYVNNLPLVSGSNTLTALHTLQAGSTEIFTQAVTGGAASAYQLTADNSCGMAPLTVNFAVTGNTIQQLDIDYDNNGSIDLTTSTPATATLQHNYTTAGVYPVTVWVTANNLVYTLSLNIVVQDPQQQTDQLKILWGNMRTALINGNKANAMQTLSVQARNTYGGVFDALMPNMATVFGELSEIEPVSNNIDIASHGIIRVENGVNKMYFINFIKGNDGVWRIDSM